MPPKKSSPNLVVNTLLRHFPDEIAGAFWRFSTDFGRERPYLGSERLEQCAATLERCFPFYKQKWGTDPEIRLEFTKHFFAGACGFGKRHLERFPLEKEHIKQLFGDEYVVTFDECNREHSEGSEDGKKTILENDYFGDYVAACRWLNIVFRTLLKEPNTDDKEMRCKFRAVLLIGYMMNKDRAYDLQQYIQPTFSKEKSMNPTLVNDFVEYYLKLHKKPSKAEDDVSEDLYTTIFNETVYVYRRRGQAKRCKYCNGYYFDGSFNKYYLHEQYCCEECSHIENVWQKKFATAAKTLKTSLRRQKKGKNVLENSLLSELLESFTYSKAKAKFNEVKSTQEDQTAKKLTINNYFLELFAALHTMDDEKQRDDEKQSTFLFRPALYAYLSGDIGYDKFHAEVTKYKREWESALYTKEEEFHDELGDSLNHILFRIC